MNSLDLFKSEKAEIFFKDDEVVKKYNRINRDALTELSAFNYLYAHPNILQLKSFNIYNNTLELILPKAKGSLNAKMLFKHLKLYIYQIFRAIDFIHMYDVIHGDIKLDNFLLFNNNRICLADFGSIVYANSPNPKFDRIATTFLYRAPELLLGCKLDEKIDVWSGIICVLLMLTSDINLIEFTGEHINEKDFQDLFEARGLFEVEDLEIDDFNEIIELSYLNKIFRFDYNWSSDTKRGVYINILNEWEREKFGYIEPPLYNKLLNKISINFPEYVGFFKDIFEPNPSLRKTAKEIMDNPFLFEAKLYIKSEFPHTRKISSCINKYYIYDLYIFKDTNNKMLIYEEIAHIIDKTGVDIGFYFKLADLVQRLDINDISDIGILIDIIYNIFSVDEKLFFYNIDHFTLDNNKRNNYIKVLKGNLADVSIDYFIDYFSQGNFEVNYDAKFLAKMVYMYNYYLNNSYNKYYLAADLTFLSFKMNKLNVPDCVSKNLKTKIEIIEDFKIIIEVANYEYSWKLKKIKYFIEQYNSAYCIVM